MTKHLSRILAGAVIAVSMCAVPVSSFAATPEEAAAIAAQYGIPDELLQECWNEYYANPELYTPETIDMMIEQLKENYKDKIISTVPYEPATNEEVPTTPVDEVAEPENETVADDCITLTMPDGTSFTRISSEQFISLSYDDKMAYLGTFSPEQQSVIIENLSPEEYKSMLKQLPSDRQLEIVDGLSDITGTFGMNITVDEISSENLSYSMKNKDGELVAVGSVKETVENTGYDRRGVFAFAGAFIMAGICGLFVMMKKCFGKGMEDE